MMELGVIVLSTAVVNNLVLVQFLGLCPFMGAAQRVEGAVGMGLATGFVLTLAAALAYLLETYLLQPLELSYLRILAFILVIAVAVQFTDMMVQRVSPLLHKVLGIYLPLIASNCAVLGVALLNTYNSRSFLEALMFGAGAALGFGLVLTLFAAIRERTDDAAVPEPFRGHAITLITAGILSLAFLGFTGLIRT